jgi:cellulose synthase/poly-beta-1,6-N-acetylglucosamine synthase-like glycosyltransferase
MYQYLRGWQNLPKWYLPKNYSPTTRIDVIIPARNEAESIGNCLKSLFENTYPNHLFQVWVVDDFSTDDTAGIVQRLQGEYANLSLIQMADYPSEPGMVAFKKTALDQAIRQGDAELILTTDADCRVPPDWLLHWAAFFETKDLVMATAPVHLGAEDNPLQRFQALDTMGMMLITGAGIQDDWMRMGNGANLAYLRTAYEAVEGFKGINHLASGDDMLLLQKMAAAFPGQIGFVKSKEIAVQTPAESNYAAFISQRLRWASKSAQYTEWKVAAALALVFLYCWAIIFSLFSVIIQPVSGLLLFLLLFLLKSGTDYLFLKRAAQFFGRKSLLQCYPLSQLHHIGYIALVGLMANFRKTYVWKGRRVY